MVWNLFYSCRIDGWVCRSTTTQREISVLLNDEEQHSLCPAFANVAADWRAFYRDANRAVTAPATRQAH
jgi:uncharacterized protein YbdZ (MbtH family)